MDNGLEMDPTWSPALRPGVAESWRFLRNLGESKNIPTSPTESWGRSLQNALKETYANTIRIEVLTIALSVPLAR